MYEFVWLVNLQGVTWMLHCQRHFKKSDQRSKMVKTFLEKRLSVLPKAFFKKSYHQSYH